MLRSFEGIEPVLGEGVYIDETALVIGRVRIGADSSFWPMTIVRGDVHEIEIGARTNIQDGCVLHVTQPEAHAPQGYGLYIGDRVTVGHKVILHACRVGNECLIGMGAVVMDGAVLEDRVLLGAGSLVPPGKVLEGGHLWLGNPARKIRPLNASEMEWFRRSADNYVLLKDRHLRPALQDVLP